MEQLPTRDALRKRLVQIESDACSLSEEVAETDDHLFTACSFACEVWQDIMAWCRLPPLFAFSISDIILYHKTVKGNKEHIKMVKPIMLLGYWSLWKAPNELIFNRIKTKAAMIVQQVKALGFRWIKASSKRGLMTEEQWRTFEFG
ncbi:uncharacterized protein LOC118488201 [Helianthus annuus]|uniref:uncharacterized protein LOC118488201 n=1 Tax=Helianthus annuus TaxID=4232 RepID=UPI001652C3BE|nr:uncharacterized protein LOC118488201 [Helianthus annuus]